MQWLWICITSSWVCLAKMYYKPTGMRGIDNTWKWSVGILWTRRESRANAMKRVVAIMLSDNLETVVTLRNPRVCFRCTGLLLSSRGLRRANLTWATNQCGRNNSDAHGIRASPTARAPGSCGFHPEKFWNLGSIWRHLGSFPSVLIVQWTSI